MIFAVIDFGRLLNAQILLTERPGKAPRRGAGCRPGCPSEPARRQRGRPGVGRRGPGLPGAGDPVRRRRGHRQSPFDFITRWVRSLACSRGAPATSPARSPSPVAESCRAFTDEDLAAAPSRPGRGGRPDGDGLGVRRAAGAGALVVDIGLIVAEREELQTGAEAAAIRVAQECAGKPSGCNRTGGSTLALGYANRNASDGAAGVTLSAAAAARSTRARCKNPAWRGCFPDRPTRHLRRGETAHPTAGRQQSLATGVRGGRGRRLRRGHRAVLRQGGLGISQQRQPVDHHFHLRVAGAHRRRQVPAASDRGDDLPAHDEIQRHLQTGRAVRRGRARWLRLADDGAADDCETPIAADGTYPADPGNNVSKPCQDMLKSLLKSGQPTLIPVFRSVTGAGNNIRYTLLGMAAFVVTGWRLPGFSANPTCDPPDSCLSGHFTQALVPATGPLHSAGRISAPESSPWSAEPLGASMSRRTLALVISVVLAVIGTTAVYLYLRSADARATAGKQARTVLVADKRIPPGTSGRALKSNDYLRAVDMPAETVPDDALREINSDLDSQVVTASVQRGQLLLRAMFADRAATSAG